MNRLTLELFAKDGISPVLIGLQKETKDFEKALREARRVSRFLSGEGLSSAANGGLLGAVRSIGINTNSLNGSFKSVGSSITNATGMLLGFNAAMMSASGLASAFAQNMMKAAKFQTQSIYTSAGLAQNLGISLPEAKELTRKAQLEISDIAAVLPGETQGYQELFNAAVIPLAKQFRGNPDAFLSKALDLTKRAGAMAAMSNSDPTETGMALNRFLSGSATYGEIRRIDGIQKSSQFQDAMVSQARAMGLDLEKSKTWTQEQRTSILLNALKTSVNDGLIKEFEGTAESLMESIKTKMFDPLKGALGFMRAIPSLGGRSVLDAFTGFLQAVTSLGGVVNRVFNSIGLAFDPMEELAKTIDWVSSQTRNIVKTLSEGAFRNLADALYGIGTSIDWAAIGELLGKGISFLVLEGINLMSDPKTWVGLTQALNSFLEGLLKGLFEGIIESAKRTIFSFGNSQPVTATNDVNKPETTGTGFTMLNTPIPGISIPLPNLSPMTNNEQKVSSVFSPQFVINGDLDRPTADHMIERLASLYQSHKQAYLGT